MTTYEEVSFLCADISKLKSKGASKDTLGRTIVARMVLHALVDRMQWPGEACEFVESGGDGRSLTCLMDFRVPNMDTKVRAVVIVRSAPGDGMYSVQCLEATKTFNIYDELALSALVAEAASQVRKGLLEQAFSK